PPPLPVSLAVLPSLYFLSLADAHPSLPSFPTRRSSDLQPVLRDAQRRPRQGPPVRGVRGLGPRAPSLVRVDAGTGPVDCAPGRRDRKSTRLNSSHEWISYAVFCLKKKNRCQDRNSSRRS